MTEIKIKSFLLLLNCLINQMNRKEMQSIVGFKIKTQSFLLRTYKQLIKYLKKKFKSLAIIISKFDLIFKH
jgi:hypothetical protein